MSQGGD
jgi:hypothetical protein